MGVPVKAEEPDGLLGMVEEDERDGVGTGRSDGERCLCRFCQRRHARVLQQPQHQGVLPGAFVPEIGFQSGSQRGETCWQCPVLQGTGEVDGTGFAFQKCQVVNGIEAGVLLSPVTPVPSKGLPSF